MTATWAEYFQLKIVNRMDGYGVSIEAHYVCENMEQLHKVIDKLMALNDELDPNM